MAEAETSPPLFFPNPPVENSTEENEENPLPVRERKTARKPSTGKSRKINVEKPPAIRGYKWAVNGAGFDCRKFTETNGRLVEIFVGYLGKKKLAEMRLQSEDKDELRQLVRQWIREKEAAKGKFSSLRMREKNQQQNQRQKDGDLQ